MSTSKVWLYRIAILWALLFVAASIITSTLAGIVNVDVSKLNTQAKTILVLTVLSNVIATLMAFLSNAARKLEEGKLPINGTTDLKIPEGTQFLSKTQVQSTTVTTKQTDEKTTPPSVSPTGT